MNHRVLFLTAFLFFWANCQFVYGNAREDLRNAATLFHQEQYEEALQIWKSLVPEHASGNLFYNIGLASSKLNLTPEAILAYEQALRFHPGNRDYLFALQEERKKLEDAIVPIQPFFLGRWLTIFLSAFRPGTWVFLGLVVGLFALITSIPDIPSSKKLKTVIRPALLKWIAALGITLILVGILSYQQLYRKDEAVVMLKCDFRQAASSESPPLRNVSPGEKVYLKDELGDWVYVSLLNLDYGWIKKDCLGIIRIDGW